MIRKIATSFGIVFENKLYIAVSVISSVIMALLYLFASQTITFFPDGIFFEFNTIRVFTLIVISALFGIVVSMQIFFLRISAIMARKLTFSQKSTNVADKVYTLSATKETGTATAGILTGLLSMSCCAPVLPGLLVLFGFSGTFLLSTTAFFGKYLLYFAFLSIGLLFLSITILSRSLTTICKVYRKRKLL